EHRSQGHLPVRAARRDVVREGPDPRVQCRGLAEPSGRRDERGWPALDQTLRQRGLPWDRPVVVERLEELLEAGSVAHVAASGWSTSSGSISPRPKWRI